MSLNLSSIFLINEVYNELEKGNICYVDIKESKVISLGNINRYAEREHYIECFFKELSHIKNNKNCVIRIKVDKRAFFKKIIKEFIVKISDDEIRKTLVLALVGINSENLFNVEIKKTKYNVYWKHYREMKMKEIINEKLLQLNEQ